MTAISGWSDHPPRTVPPSVNASLAAGVIADVAADVAKSGGIPSEPLLGAPWSPDGRKYLLALCSTGGMSNHLFCLREFALMAGALNRTLVVPTGPHEVGRGSMQVTHVLCLVKGCHLVRFPPAPSPSLPTRHNQPLLPGPTPAMLSPRAAPGGQFMASKGQIRLANGFESPQKSPLCPSPLLQHQAGSSGASKGRISLGNVTVPAVNHSTKRAVQSEQGAHQLGECDSASSGAVGVVGPAGQTLYASRVPDGVLMIGEFNKQPITDSTFFRMLAPVDLPYLLPRCLHLFKSFHHALPPYLSPPSSSPSTATHHEFRLLPHARPNGPPVPAAPTTGQAEGEGEACEEASGAPTTRQAEGEGQACQGGATRNMPRVSRHPGERLPSRWEIAVQMGDCRPDGRLPPRWEIAAQMGDCRPDGRFPPRWEIAAQMGDCRPDGRLPSRWEIAVQMGDCRPDGRLPPRWEIAAQMGDSRPDGRLPPRWEIAAQMGDSRPAPLPQPPEPLIAAARHIVQRHLPRVNPLSPSVSFHALSPSSLAPTPQPPEALIAAARHIVQRHLLNGRFLAVQFRRGDFKDYCRKKHPSDGCFLPVDQAAQCMRAAAVAARVPLVFLATNARPQELESRGQQEEMPLPPKAPRSLQGVAQLTGPDSQPLDQRSQRSMPAIARRKLPGGSSGVEASLHDEQPANTSSGPDALNGSSNAVQLVTLAHLLSKEDSSTWLQPLMENGINIKTTPQAVATLEKLVCALGAGFLGTAHSTFTNDIVRLRHGFRTAMCSDHYICSAGPKEG
ncbi:unnamed protein product [Closterium sp. Naga37s-1]|nr:unnamed protein product [Closterium sp. Naga37s-1]